MARKILHYLLIFLILTIMGICQEYNPAEAKLKVFKITNKLYKLQCISGTYVNTLALVGNDGMLLVDTGYRQTADLLKKELDKLGKGKVRILINTHEHSDHIFGNGKFAADAVIVSHERVRQVYGGRYFALTSTDLLGVPQLVFKDELKIYLNDEEVHLKHYPKGHSLGDIIVYLPWLKIAHVGDMIFADCFPSADISIGGDLNHCLKNVQKIIDDYPSDTLFINGHGPDYRMKDLKKYLAVGLASREAVETQIKKGKTVEEIVKSGVLDQWKEWGTGVVSPEEWVTCVHLQYLKDRGKLKTSISKPLSEAIVKGKLEEISKIYHWLAEKEKDQYDFSENHLNALGYHLMNRKMYREAIEVLRVNVRAYPDSGNVYDSLAEAYMLSGNQSQAIRFYKISLEKNPKNDNARIMLKKLQK